MTCGSELFVKYSPLKRGLDSVKYYTMESVGQLSAADIAVDREDRVASDIASGYTVGVDADFSKRTATKREVPATHGAQGPTVDVRYHIPASGQLDLLKLSPAANPRDTPIEAFVTTLKHVRGIGGDSYPVVQGEIGYEIPAAMDSEAHKQLANETAQAIEELVGLVNEEVAAFRVSLEADVKSAIRDRRERAALASSTLEDLDVPFTG